MGRFCSTAPYAVAVTENSPLFLKVETVDRSGIVQALALFSTRDIVEVMRAELNGFGIIELPTREAVIDRLNVAKQSGLDQVLWDFEN